MGQTDRFRHGLPADFLVLWLLLSPRERRRLVTFCSRKGYGHRRQHLSLIGRRLRQFRHGCFLVRLRLPSAAYWRRKEPPPRDCLYDVTTSSAKWKATACVTIGTAEDPDSPCSIFSWRAQK
jgi:hypothetical protein